MLIVAHLCHPTEAVIADPEVALRGEERPQVRQKSAGDERPRRKNLFTVGAFDLRPEVGLPAARTRCVDLGHILEISHVLPYVDLGEDLEAQIVEDRASVLGVHVHGKLGQCEFAVSGKCRRKNRVVCLVILVE